MNQTQPRILIIDDDEDDYFLTRDYIRHIPNTAYQIDWCYKYEDALQRMIGREYDLYFVDYRMGAHTGVELLTEALAGGCTEPVILLTGKGNYNVDIKAMQLGAFDYLVKTDLSVEKMERCIRYSLERAATMKALRNNELKYRSIFEKSKDLVFITDEGLRFKDINDACFNLLGYTREELLTMKLSDLAEQDQDKFLMGSAAYNDQEIDDWEVTLVTKTDERKSCVLSLVKVNEATQQQYLQGIIHDITNMKKAEKIAIQSEKTAAAGRLVRTLAHEVRNPLNNIMLSVEEIMGDIKDEQSSMYIDIIQRNCKRISHLISELLNTSYPSDIRLMEHNLQSIVDDVISSAIDRLTLKKIRLNVDYPTVPLQVMADRDKLKIALLNIVINAIEAMDGRAEHEGALEISIRQQDQSVVVTISDNGCGISKENISRLFEPYFTKKRNGVGLGLSFTLNILQAHRAAVEVNSELDQGTSFVITFPVAELVRSAQHQQNEQMLELG